MATVTAFLTTSGVYFNPTSGGDFLIENGDLKIVRNSLYTRVQSLKDEIKSDRTDYYFYPELGSTLANNIGKGMDDELQASIEKILNRCILDTNLFEQDEFSIYSVVDKNTLYIRVFLLEDTEDEIVLNLMYNQEKGMVIQQ